MAKEDVVGPSNKGRSQQRVKRFSYALDSSVLVASLAPTDVYYDLGTKIVQRLINGNNVFYASVIVPIEVCAAISRRTKDQQVVHELKMQFKNWIRLGRLKIAYLTKLRMERAQDLAAKYYLRGMDSIVVQVAEEKSIPIITFDHEVADRISRQLKVITHLNIDDFTL